MKKIALSALVLLVAIDCLACTAAIVSAGASATGRPLLWKHRDNKLKNGVVFSQEGKYAFTAITGHKGQPVVSVVAGMNEVGFAIINTSDKYLNEGSAKATNSRIICRALENCRTVEEFEKMIVEMPVPRPLAGNFGVIDACGGAAFFECGSRKMFRRDVPENGWLVTTNFPVSQDPDFKCSSRSRYDTATMLMESHGGKFTPEFLMDTLGRSTYDIQFGKDLREFNPDGYGPYNKYCILRMDSIADVCIEGIGKGDRKNSSVMWTACGYPGGCYAVPVWVAAGESIPECLKVNFKTGACKVFNHARKLRDDFHRVEFNKKPIDAYMNYAHFIPVQKLIRKYESVEFSKGRELDAKMRKRFDQSAVDSFNGAADERFLSFKEECKLILED